MSWPSIFITLIFISVFEAASCNYIKLCGVGPEFLLLGILYFGLNTTKETGALCGLIGGILKMALSGTHSLILIIYISIGFLAGLFKEAIYKELPLAQAILSFITVTYQALLYNLLISTLGLPYHKALFFISLPSAIYTSALAPLVFILLEFLLPPRQIEYKEIIFKKRVFEGGRPE